jgi:hypothetical protein
VESDPRRRKKTKAGRSGEFAKMSSMDLPRGTELTSSSLLLLIVGRSSCWSVNYLVKDAWCRSSSRGAVSPDRSPKPEERFPELSPTDDLVCHALCCRGKAMLPLISLLCCIGYSAVKLILLRPNGRTLFLSPTRLLSAIPGICLPGPGGLDHSQGQRDAGTLRNYDAWPCAACGWRRYGSG